MKPGLERNGTRPYVPLPQWAIHADGETYWGEWDGNDENGCLRERGDCKMNYTMEKRFTVYTRPSRDIPGEERLQYSEGSSQYLKCAKRILAKALDRRWYDSEGCIYEGEKIVCSAHRIFDLGKTVWEEKL
jgi:hypothetical protein